MLIFMIILATLMTSPVTATGSELTIEPPPIPAAELFDVSVNQWIKEIAKRPEFAEWRAETVSWERHPLGPGLHGWIVMISNTDRSLGYLVVTVDPDGHYVLGEYGVGEYPLFSENT